MNLISIRFCCQAIFLRVAFIYWLKCLLMVKISRRHFIPFSWFDNQKGTPWEAHQGDFSVSKLFFDIAAEDARFCWFNIGLSLRSHIVDSETSTLLQLASIVTHLNEIFVAIDVHVWYEARRMMFQRPTQQFSLANLAKRCLLWSYLREFSWLDLSKFSISCVFEAVFPNGYLLDFGHLMLFLNHDKWICFWTAVSGGNCSYSLLWLKTYNIWTWKYEKASLIFVGNVRKKSLVSMLHSLKQLLWNRIVRGIFALGFRKSDTVYWYTHRCLAAFFDSLLSWLSSFWSKI